MQDSSRKDSPLIEGGQGRSGASLEQEAKYLVRFSLVALVAVLALGYLA